MFLKKSILFLVMVGFVFVCGGIGFAQEGAKVTDTGEVKDELKVPAPQEAGEVVKSHGEKAAYNAMELVMKLGGVSTPSKVTVIPDGNICVAEAGLRISIFDSKGEKIDQIGDKPIVDGEDETKRITFNWLCSIDSDNKGNIYTACYKTPAVSVINPDGELLFSIPMNPALQKSLPGIGSNSVLINSRGDIYICDQENGVVSIYSMNGKYKYSIQSFKTKTGERLGLARPSDMAVNSKDEVYITDGVIFRVHRFNAKGNFLGSFGGQGDAAGLFVKMTSIAIDSKDRVYILDASRSIIQVFTPTGEFLYALSDPTGGPMPIPMASRISIDKRTDYLYVSQGLGQDGVSIFKYVVAEAAKSLTPQK